MILMETNAEWWNAVEMLTNIGNAVVIEMI